MEGENSVVITDPVYSADILPTVSNLFGMEFDSRVLAGRDVLDPGTEPLVIFSDYSWLSSYGYYNHVANTFTPIDELKTSKETIPACFSDWSDLKTITWQNTTGHAYGAYDDLDDYIKHTKNVVKNKMVLSQNIPLYDYYGLIWGQIETEEVSE